MLFIVYKIAMNLIFQQIDDSLTSIPTQTYIGACYTRALIQMNVDF